MVRVLIALSLVNLALDYPLLVALLLVAYTIYNNLNNEELEKISTIYSIINSKLNKPTDKAVKIENDKDEDWLKYYPRVPEPIDIGNGKLKYKGREYFKGEWETLMRYNQLD